MTQLIISYEQKRLFCVDFMHVALQAKVMAKLYLKLFPKLFPLLPFFFFVNLAM